MALLDEQGRGLHARLWYLTQRADVAEDLMQELVIKLAASGTFAKADRPGAFALRSATNLALDWRRQQKRRKRGSGAAWSVVEPELADASAGPLEKLQQSEQIDRLLDALAQMKPADRVVLTMRYLEEADYDTVANTLGKTVPQARGLCFKAVGRLRKRMAAASPSEVHHDA